MSSRLDRIRDLYDRMDSRIVPGLIGVAIIVGVLLLALRGTGNINAATVQITIDAAATMTNAQFPALAASLSQTPPDALLTGAAPTLAVAGRDAVDQYAASVTATSQLGKVDWSAVQAAGAPNTPSCGDARTAWAPAQSTSQETLTAYFPELVRPTGLMIYQTNSPGFITQVSIMDTFGTLHTVYQAAPQLSATCPWILTISISIGPCAFPVWLMVMLTILAG